MTSRHTALATVCTAYILVSTRPLSFETLRGSHTSTIRPIVTLADGSLQATSCQLPTMPLLGNPRALARNMATESTMVLDPTMQHQLHKSCTSLPAFLVSVLGRGPVRTRPQGLCQLTSRLTVQPWISQDHNKYRMRTLLRSNNISRNISRIIQMLMTRDPSFQRQQVLELIY